MKNIKIKDIEIGKNAPLTFICGPCVIEDEETMFEAAYELKKIFSKFNFNFFFKASFDKANRSSIDSYRGPGIEKGLQILNDIKEKYDLLVTTDIHLPHQADIVKDVVDIIQIPAFLCRQTDLLVAAGKTNLAINVKKGQFLSPYEMKNVIDKILSTGNDKIILTDRGTSFGYNNLVSDFRSILIMKKFNFPVCYDASHSVQLPAGLGNVSSGQREFIPSLTKAAVAVGANAIFIESHPNPAIAKSDKKTQVPIAEMEELLIDIEKIYNAINTKVTC
ncbi:MAG: 2-dehydro-3-deoxyphosphooctonate aldolase [Candidatus Anoxychlamydiales bacterium]|nr:2-dehydro-3-deoxyphosphooctonate aldolase [Candidatus Anoxychlamydiales bacterium]